MEVGEPTSTEKGRTTVSHVVMKQGTSVSNAQLRRQGMSITDCQRTPGVAPRKTSLDDSPLGSSILLIT